MKVFWKSKTFWINFLGLIAMMFPQSNALIAQYFTEAGIGWAVVNMLLRFITNEKIVIS